MGGHSFVSKAYKLAPIVYEFFLKAATLQGKEFTPQWSIFFPLRAAPFVK